MTSDNAMRIYRVQHFNYEVNKKPEITHMFNPDFLMGLKYMLPIGDEVFIINYRSGDKYFFDIIEFFGTKYSVKRVEVKGERVLKPLIELKKGSVFDLFGCIAEIRMKTNEEMKTTTKSRPTPEDHTSLIRFFIWLIVCLFIGGILVIFLSMTFFYWRKLERRRLREEAKEAAKKQIRTERKDSPSDNVMEGPKQPTDTTTETE